jgi:hypothetical protein
MLHLKPVPARPESTDTGTVNLLEISMRTSVLLRAAIKSPYLKRRPFPGMSQVVLLYKEGVSLQ